MSSCVFVYVEIKNDTVPFKRIQGTKVYVEHISLRLVEFQPVAQVDCIWLGKNSWFTISTFFTFRTRSTDLSLNKFRLANFGG